MTTLLVKNYLKWKYNSILVMQIPYKFPLLDASSVPGNNLHRPTHPPDDSISRFFSLYFSHLIFSSHLSFSLSKWTCTIIFQIYLSSLLNQLMVNFHSPRLAKKVRRTSTSFFFSFISSI